MATFNVPAQKRKYPFVLNEFNGLDSYNLMGDFSRPSYMQNMIKKDGVTQIRGNLEQHFIKKATNNQNDDSNYDIKYVGDFEKNGKTYYIKISEFMGEEFKENASSIMISIWQTPDVRNTTFCDTTTDEYYSNYINSYKRFSFTNVGKTGNDKDMYNDIIFNDNKYVFTPIGILSFNCYYSVQENGKTKLDFDIENVLNNPYVPTTFVSVNPSGTTSSTKMNESLNLISDQRKVQYLSDGTSTIYHLPEKYITSVDLVQVMNSIGIMEEYSSSNYTVNANAGTVTFNSAIEVSPIDGKDNLYITYTKKYDLTSSESISSVVSSENNIVKCNVELSKETVGDTLTVTPTATTSVDSGFQSSTDTITSVNLKIYGNDTLYVDNTSTSVGVLTLTSFNIPVSTNSYGMIWKVVLTCSYNRTITIGVPGSTSGSKSGNTGKLNGILGQNYYTDQKIVSYLGLYCSYSVIPNVAGYADVYVTPQIWVNGKASYGYGSGAFSQKFHAFIDGTDVEGGASGAMSTNTSQGDVYFPNSPTTVSKRIYYSGSGKSIQVKLELRNFNSTIAGTYYSNLHSSYFTLYLPTITLNSQSSATNNYSDNGIKDISDTVDVAKTLLLKVPGSAKLACYYSAKYVTVFGYQNDMRVFVSDGTNYDCYSDGNKISYFPDDNYTSLGEKTSIKGYAKLGNYLYTFKDGEDSVYVRYGSTFNEKTAFPSVHNSKDLNILGSPIQLENEILIITKDGIKSIYYNGSYLKTELRSYYINNYFYNSIYNWDKMQWFKEENLLHILVDKYEFVADLSSKSNVKDVTSSGTKYSYSNEYQYEWYVNYYQSYYNNYSVNFSIYLKNDLWLYKNNYVNDYYIFGYSNDGVYEINYDNPKVDIILTDTSTTYLPIKAKMITQFLNLNTIMKAKTIRTLYINTMSKTGDKFYIGYIDDNGSQILLEKYYEKIIDFQTPWRNKSVGFPKLIQIQSKIRKFMNIKLYFENIEGEPTNINVDDLYNYQNMAFFGLSLEYEDAGKYRGE